MPQIPFEVIPFDDKATVIYSQIRADVEKTGLVIGPNDSVIASIVLANEGCLVTNNEKGFRRIPDLNIQNWMK
jgi:tRNA(fMet)-specific endonuclease VapC